MKELQSQWYVKNKEKINAKFNERYHNVNSDFKKIKNYRTGLNHLIRGHQKTTRYLGCNRETLVVWLTSCFEDGMTMENYGDVWSIDHVLPLNLLADNPEWFDQLLSWRNVVPVPKDFNLVKNKKINIAQIEKHLDRIQQNHTDESYEALLARHLVAGSPLEP